MEKDEFECYRCKGIFKKGFTDSEAEKQLEKEFGKDIITEDCELLCDDCFKEMFGE